MVKFLIHEELTLLIKIMFLIEICQITRRQTSELKDMSIGHEGLFHALLSHWHELVPGQECWRNNAGEDKQ